LLDIGYSPSLWLDGRESSTNARIAESKRENLTWNY
jgi:hypothetical protein